MQKQHISNVYFTKIKTIFLLIGLTALAFFIRLELSPALADRIPLAIFIINSLLLTQLFGLPAGFSSLFIGAVLSYYYFVPPYSSFVLPEAFHLSYFCVKLIIGNLLILFVDWVNNQTYQIHNHH